MKRPGWLAATSPGRSGRRPRSRLHHLPPPPPPPWYQRGTTTNATYCNVYWHTIKIILASSLADGWEAHSSPNKGTRAAGRQLVCESALCRTYPEVRLRV